MSVELVIQAMLLSHDMGCRRSAVLIQNNIKIEQIIEKCQELTKIYETEIREKLKGRKK